MSKDLIAVGKIVGFQGLKGEVKVLPLTDNPGRYNNLKEVRLVSGEKMIKAEVEKGRENKNNWVLKFKNYNSREEVDFLRGYYIMIPKEERLILPEDHYYLDDIIGMTAYNEDEKIGEVIDIIQTGSNDVFVVKPEEPSLSRDILIPALKAVVREVDLPGKRLILKLPEGLID
ncbi:MAG: 16S rRNA processing protein RimM [Firmicutes bacterium HGW-Firmicutes-13]|nr:MAG: 16S rRNA processing protein RimM [Firmicutes bacterium HGW-Firmicutes-13]